MNPQLLKGIQMFKKEPVFKNQYELDAIQNKLGILLMRKKIEEFKETLESYTPEQQKKIINSPIYSRDNTLFNMAVLFKHIDIIKYLIEKGANVNIVYTSDSSMKMTNALLDAIEMNNMEIVKLLVENGAKLTTPNGSKYKSIIYAVFEYMPFQETIETLKYLLQKGVNVNAIDAIGYTPLLYYISSKEYEKINKINGEVLKVLLDAGANPNVSVGGTALDILALSNYQIRNIPYIKLLRSYGAEITSTIQDAINRGEVPKEVIDVLEIKKDSWKGWTQSDAKALDTVFGEPANYSACPVCLKYSLRQDGCMYMSHKCPDLGGLYNRKLYDMYKNDEGIIYWCTLCDRICLGHRHYKLSSYDTKAELGEGGHPFAKDCRPYGGGYPEKVQRFNRLREYALDLNQSKNISAKTAFNELTEEFWNAPMRREKRKIEGIIEKKKFGNNANFPPNRPSNNVNNVITPNIPIPATLVMPILMKGYNSISMNDDVDVLQFHHETTGGIDHKDSLIGVKTLNEQLADRVKNFGDENFGYCIAYPECNARLYPDEIKLHIPDELYKEYKKKFNKKFKNTSGGRRTRKRGGGDISFFEEATNVQCVLNGGRRTRKRKANSRRTLK